MTRVFKAKRMTENGRSMRSKGLALLLSALLAVGLLGGCGAGDSGTGETGAAGDAVISGFGAAGESSGSASEGSETDGPEDAGQAPAALTTLAGMPAVEVLGQQEINRPEDNARNYYEIFVYSFYDSDGDGHGDLGGVTQKLDYIREMGFNGIWLMPICPSPTYHKYDVTDYMAIDELYGTEEDFAQLMQEAHARDIRVIIDMVINHTSSKHPWFTQAKDYLRSLEPGEEPDPEDCPYVGYYHFSAEQVDSTWYRVAGTDWFYEGSFWSEMPDLNLENKALRAELEQVADYWLGLGVDGFRMDAALHFDEKDTALNTETLNWLYTYCLAQNPDFYMVSEVWASEDTIAQYYASGTPSMFNFDLAQAEGKLLRAARGRYSARTLAEALVKYEEDFGAQNPDYIDAPFLTNHDMGRVSNALNNKTDAIKRAGGVLSLMRGSSFVYYGEEIGMPSKGTEDENKRLPMLWSSEGAEGENGMTRRPEGAAYGVTSAFEGVQEQLTDPESILNYYRRALRLRNENPEIARGRTAITESLCSKTILAISRKTEEGGILILMNLGDEPESIRITGVSDTYADGSSYDAGSMGLYSWVTLSPEDTVTLDAGILTIPDGGIAVLR